MQVSFLFTVVSVIGSVKLRNLDGEVGEAVTLAEMPSDAVQPAGLQLFLVEGMCSILGHIPYICYI
ncbi:MAG TPA: hypothetical protein DHW15_05165 [Bacteroidetes bacterium]|jgi:hypothetical protein|nr:hypothetical protein [Bacteroidota bacterium]